MSLAMGAAGRSRSGAWVTCALVLTALTTLGADPGGSRKSVLSIVGALAAWLIFRGAVADAWFLLSLAAFASTYVIGIRASRAQVLVPATAIITGLALSALIAATARVPGLVHGSGDAIRASGPVAYPGALGALAVVNFALVGDHLVRRRLGNSLVAITLAVSGMALGASGSRASLLAGVAVVFLARGTLERNDVLVVVMSTLTGALILHSDRPVALALVGATVAAAAFLDNRPFISWRPLLTLAAIAATAAMLGMSPVRVSDTRTSLWASGVADTLGSPLVGGGFGRLRVGTSATNLHITPYLHSEPLELLAGGGVVALLLAIGLVFTVRADLARRGNTVERVALAGLLIASLFDFTFHLPAVASAAGWLSSPRSARTTDAT